MATYSEAACAFGACYAPATMVLAIPVAHLLNQILLFLSTHTWMTRTRVSGYFSKTDWKAVAGRRRTVEGTAALADTVL